MCKKCFFGITCIVRAAGSNPIRRNRMLPDDNKTYVLKHNFVVKYVDLHHYAWYDFIVVTAGGQKQMIYTILQYCGHDAI